MYLLRFADRQGQNNILRGRGSGRSGVHHALLRPVPPTITHQKIHNISIPGCRNDKKHYTFAVFLQGHLRKLELGKTHENSAKVRLLWAITVLHIDRSIIYTYATCHSRIPDCHYQSSFVCT